MKSTAKERYEQVELGKAVREKDYDTFNIILTTRGKTEAEINKLWKKMTGIQY